MSTQIEARNRAYKTYKTQPTAENEKILINTRTAKRKLEMDIVESSIVNPKGFFSFVSNRKPVKSKIGPLVNTQGRVECELHRSINLFVGKKI